MMYDSRNRCSVVSSWRPVFLLGIVCSLACGLLLAAAPAALADQPDEPGAAEPAEEGGEVHAVPQEAAHDDHGHGHLTQEGLHKNVYDPTSLRTDLAVWTFVVFLVVLALLWKFAWGPIVEGLERREQRIADNIAAAERQNKQAAEQLKAYELKLQNAANEVREILEEARRDAQHTQEEILAKARQEAEAERQRALRDIDIATEQSLKRIGEEGANLAVDLAGRIIRAQLKPEDHSRLIQEAMGEFASRTPSAN